MCFYIRVSLYYDRLLPVFSLLIAYISWNLFSSNWVCCLMSVLWLLMLPNVCSLIAYITWCHMIIILSDIQTLTWPPGLRVWRRLAQESPRRSLSPSPYKTQTQAKVYHPLPVVSMWSFWSTNFALNRDGFSVWCRGAGSSFATWVVGVKCCCEGGEIKFYCTGTEVLL